MKTYDVCLGRHVAATTTSKKAADSLKEAFDAVADELYQHEPAAVRAVDRAEPPPKKKSKKK